MWKSCSTSLHTRTSPTATEHHFTSKAIKWIASSLDPDWKAAWSWRCVVRTFLPAPLMWLAFLNFLLFVLYCPRARSLLRVVSSVHLWRRLWAERLASDSFKCFSSWPLSVFFFFFEGVSRHPRLVENHRPASSEQQESCGWCIYEPHTSSEYGESEEKRLPTRCFSSIPLSVHPFSLISTYLVLIPEYSVLILPKVVKSHWNRPTMVRAGAVHRQNDKEFSNYEPTMNTAAPRRPIVYLKWSYILVFQSV